MVITNSSLLEKMQAMQTESSIEEPQIVATQADNVNEDPLLKKMRLMQGSALTEQTPTSAPSAVSTEQAPTSSTTKRSAYPEAKYIGEAITDVPRSVAAIGVVAGEAGASGIGNFAQNLEEISGYLEKKAIASNKKTGNKSILMGGNKEITDAIAGGMEGLKNYFSSVGNQAFAYASRIKAEEGKVTPTELERFFGNAIGGAIPGMAEFGLGPAYAMMLGAAEASAGGDNEVVGAVVGGAKRYMLGKVFSYASQLQKPLSIVAGGGIFAGQAAAEGGSPEDIAKAFGTGTLYASVGKPGTVSGKQILRDILPERILKPKTIYQAFINKMQAIEDIQEKAKVLGWSPEPGVDVEISARNFLGIISTSDSVIRKGIFKVGLTGDYELVVGKDGSPISLNGIFEAAKTVQPVKPYKATEALTIRDWDDFFVSTRRLKGLNQPRNAWSEKTIVTKKQMWEAQEKLDDLSQRYGGLERFEAIAEKYYEYNSHLVHLLVDANVITEGMYTDIIAKNPYYIPMNRIFEEIEKAGGNPITSEQLSAVKNPLFTIRGSDRTVESWTTSTIKDTHRIINEFAKNRLMNQISKFAGIVPESDLNIYTPPKYPISLTEHEIKTIREKQGNVALFEEPFIKGKDVYKSPSLTMIRKTGGIDRIKAQGDMDSFTFKESGTTGLVAAKGKGSSPDLVLERLIEAGLLPKGSSINDLWAHINKEVSLETRPSISSEMEYQQYLDKEYGVLSPEKEAPPTTLDKFTLFRESAVPPTGKGNYIPFFDKGVKKFMEVNPQLFKSLSTLNEASANLALQIVSAPAHLLRTGATITPEFILRNTWRDQLTAWIQTDTGFIPFVDTAWAIADIIGKKDVYYDWMRHGGGRAAYSEVSRVALTNQVHEVMEKPSNFQKLNIITRLQDLSNLMENSTRLGVFKSAQRKGASMQKAAFMSREGTVDFARRGSAMKNANLTIAFLNAGIQGADRTVRAFNENPAGCSLRAIIGVTIPSFFSWYLNKDNEYYKELPKWQKDLCWIFPNPLGGEDSFIRIPKPFLVGQIFGTLPERFWDYTYTQDKTAFRQLHKTMIDALLPVSGDPNAMWMPTGLKPIVENAMDYSFFRERPITSERQKRLLPEQRYGPYTSETIKTIGKKLGVSPVSLENLVQGYLGGSGKYALDALDAVGRIGTKETVGKRPLDAGDIPLVKGFVTRSAATNPESLNIFYNKAQTISQAYESFNKLKEEGKYEEALSVRRKYPTIDMISTVRASHKQINDLTDKINEVIGMVMPDDSKRPILKALENQRMLLAKKAVELMQQREDAMKNFYKKAPGVGL